MHCPFQTLRLSMQKSCRARLGGIPDARGTVDANLAKRTRTGNTVRSGEALALRKLANALGRGRAIWRMRLNRQKWRGITAPKGDNWGDKPKLPSEFIHQFQSFHEGKWCPEEVVLFPLQALLQVASPAKQGVSW